MYVTQIKGKTMFLPPALPWYFPHVPSKGLREWMQRDVENGGRSPWCSQRPLFLPGTWRRGLGFLPLLMLDREAPGEELGPQKDGGSPRSKFQRMSQTLWTATEGNGREMFPYVFMWDLKEELIRSFYQRDVVTASLYIQSKGFIFGHFSV